MLKRTAARFVYEKFEGISGDKGHMTLQQACTIFGFQMNEEWTRQEIRKRFLKLALKCHPDNGGTSEQFQMLKEAQKIMISHRHHKGPEPGTEGAGEKGGINFRRMNYDEMTNTIHRQTADRKEYRSFSIQDFAVFFVFISFAIFYYMYRAWLTQRDVIRSRWSMTEEDVRGDYVNKSQREGAWHPWMADNATRECMDEIGLIQGNIRAEVVEEKRKQAPQVYTPWQAGGPFARNKAPHHILGEELLPDIPSEEGTLATPFAKKT